MAARTLLAIMLYFGIRVILQSDAGGSIDSSRRFRVILGFLFLPLVSISYWLYVLNYDSCTLCAPPVHISIFLGWLVFLVTDCLHQMLMLSRNS